MKCSHTWFDENVARTLADESLRAVIGQTSQSKIESRVVATAKVPNFEQLRDLATQIKQHTIEHLDHYLERFIEQVRANGGIVHFAATAADANACIARIAQDNGLKLAVKVKAMTTEETGLNAALAAAGVQVFETDLGEFIVQLDNDRPSHIVTPIIHKNRQTIARAMQRELGVPYTEDPETLTRYAREHLRDVFRRCDLGISGVNFGVAETGTICICTNEGNGRLSTTRPRVHVALMGIEKVIPRLVDLSVFLKVLSRSNTGQPITVYTSLMNGPRRESDPDGPEQLHVVLLDNGRRAIQQGRYREILHCIRCGACLNACPVYRHIGGHAYDSVYPGPIGKVLTPLLNDPKHYADLPQASSLCGFCRDVCPVRIDIPDLLVRLRRDQADGKAVPWLRRLAFRALFWALSTPRLMRWSQRVLRWGTVVGAKGDWNSRLPGPAAQLTRHRDTPRPAAKTFRDLWQSERDRGDQTDQ